MGDQNTRSTRGVGGTNKSKQDVKTVSNVCLQTLLKFNTIPALSDQIGEMHKGYVDVISKLNVLNEDDVFQYNELLGKITLPSIYAGLVQPSSIKVEPKSSYIHLGVPKRNVDDVIGIQGVYDLVAISNQLNQQEYVNLMKTRKGYSFVNILERLQPVTWETVENKCAFYNPAEFDGNVFNLTLYGGESKLRGTFDGDDEFFPYLVQDRIFGSIISEKYYPKGDGSMPIRRYFLSQNQVSVKGGMTSTAHEE